MKKKADFTHLGTKRKSWVEAEIVSEMKKAVFWSTNPCCWILAILRRGRRA